MSRNEDVPVYRMIRNQWNRYHLTKQIQTTTIFYDSKIEATDSLQEIRRIRQQKIDHICEIATRYLERNTPHQ